MFEETVTLILKHSDISSNLNDNDAISEYGSWSNGKQKTIFRVNLKTLMGTLYNKYNTFCLRLNQIAYSSANFPQTNNIDQQVIIQMSGLNFINSTYNQARGTNGSNYQMVILNIEKGLAKVIDYSPNVSICNFRKSSEMVELNIDLIRCSDGLPATSGTNDKFPHFTYSFDIYPVLE